MRYCIIFSYDGTDYHGWQFQPNANSVQEELEKALYTTLRQKVSVTGAGRTDTGVHARMMACHFDWPEQIDCAHLAFKLNCLLPEDVAVSEIKPVADDWHARFSATARTYHYYITTSKDAFNRRYALRLYFPLDIEQMNRAAELLLHHSDFGCFCKSHSDNKTNLCTVTEARWIRQDAHSFYFRVTANRFLRNMVRAIVGTLIEVGKGKMTIEQFEQVLHSGSRSNAGESVPAHGLFLENVNYPD